MSEPTAAARQTEGDMLADLRRSAGDELDRSAYLEGALRKLRTILARPDHAWTQAVRAEVGTILRQSRVAGAVTLARLAQDVEVASTEDLNGLLTRRSELQLMLDLVDVEAATTAFPPVQVDEVDDELRSRLAQGDPTPLRPDWVPVSHWWWAERSAKSELLPS